MRLPKDFTEYEGETLMSNFDHAINDSVVEAIKGNALYGTYSAWDFFGYVWWSSEINKWCCEIWRYNSWSETISFDDLEEIMHEASLEYGQN